MAKFGANGRNHKPTSVAQVDANGRNLKPAPAAKLLVFFGFLFDFSF
jgi:hypothetical protein